MMVLNIVAGDHGTVVPDRLVGDMILRDGFLEQDIPGITFITENRVNRGARPFRTSLGRNCPKLVHAGANAFNTLSLFIKPEYLLHRPRLIRNDLIAPVFILLIAVEPAPAVHAALKTLADTPDGVLGNGAALLLSEGGEYRQQHLREGRPGVDAVVLKDDVDAQAVQMPDVGKALESISGESAD